MRKLTFLFACLFIAGVSMVLAQTSISGKVISAEDGEEIVGATVMVKGTTTGTITNVNGNFTISLSGTNRTLVVSYVGMKTAEVLATPNMIVRLESDAAELEEVLVVAYGTTKRSSFTGSAAVVKSDAIEKRQASNVTNTLSGQIAGVQGINSDGAPGSGSKIRIRGIGSMYASNAPLYVVDGIPYDGDISAINTTDIESVTVLKDAASNALYGARGANGVIMITTKKGNSRVARINVDAKWGNNSRGVDNYSVMTDPGMYYETHYQALYNSQFLDGKTSHVAHDFANKNLLDAANGGLGYQVYSVPAGERLIGSNGKLNPQATLGYTEGQFTYLPDIWYDEVFKKNNLRQEYNINISGTEGKMNYYMSAGYLDDTGIIENSGLSRLSTRLNVDYQAREWLKVGSNLSYTNSKNRYPDEQTTDDDISSANLFFVANAIAPIYPLYIRDASGKIMIDSNGYTMYDYGDGATVPKIRSFMGMSNPASAIALDNSIYADDIFNGKWFANIDITEGLKASANFGVYAANSRYNFSLNPYYGQYASTGGVANVEHNRKFAVNQNYLLTYDKEFDGVHNVGVLAGFESYAYKSQNLWGSKEKMYSNTPEISNAILNPSTESSTDTYSTMGFLARANYDYVGKYHFSASYRRDASSRFHPDHRWGNFWSGGFGWIMNKESFLEDQSWINLLKFKMSYGAQGNDDLGNYYAYLDQYSVVMQDDDFATTLKYKGNKDLTWETSHNFNTGFDFSLFADRLGGTIEYFSRTTSDMLYYKPVSPSLGYSELPVNVGSVRNAGVEIDLNGKVYSSRDLKITAYANATLLKNTILELEE
ncbi:MAG: SusC/RagA family TonB-linked outer membrane protein, partial [Paludibacter sp.]|nr:SusC/RagA family TonB-linked outer membrane protein [Paludibacter sp.]